MNNRVKSAKTKPAEREQYETIPSFYRKTLIYLPYRQIYQGKLYDHLNLRRQIKQWFTDTNIVMIPLSYNRVCSHSTIKFSKNHLKKIDKKNPIYKINPVYSD